MRQGRSREARGQTPRSCRVRNRSGGRHGLAPLAAPRLPRRVPEAIFGARLPCTSPEVLHSCPEPGSHRSHGPRPRNRRLFRRRADGSRRRSQVRQRGERKAAVNLHLRRRLERGPGHRRVAARDERRRGRHAARRRDRDRLRRIRRPGPGGPSGLHLRVQRVPTLRRERDGPRGAPDHRPRSRPRRATSCRAPGRTRMAPARGPDCSDSAPGRRRRRPRDASAPFHRARARGGLGVGATELQIPIPMPPLRQQ